MQILEIYIHTIIYIHIHTYTTSSTTTTTHHHPHHPHHRGGGYWYIHIHTYTTSSTTTTTATHHHPHHPHHRGEGGTPPPTTTHHPHHRGEGGTGALLYRPITMGWGGGEVPSDAGPYIYSLSLSLTFSLSLSLAIYTYRIYTHIHEETETHEAVKPYLIELLLICLVFLDLPFFFWGPDDQMYAEPRLAEHLDLTSLQNMTNVYDAIFKAWKQQQQQQQQQPRWRHFCRKQLS